MEKEIQSAYESGYHAGCKDAMEGNSTNAGNARPETCPKCLVTDKVIEELKKAHDGESVEADLVSSRERNRLLKYIEVRDARIARLEEAIREALVIVGPAAAISAHDIIANEKKGFHGETLDYMKLRNERHQLAHRLCKEALSDSPAPEKMEEKCVWCNETGKMSDGKHCPAGCKPPSEEPSRKEAAHPTGRRYSSVDKMVEDETSHNSGEEKKGIELLAEMGKDIQTFPSAPIVEPDSKPSPEWRMLEIGEWSFIKTDQELRGKVWVPCSADVKINEFNTGIYRTLIRPKPVAEGEKLTDRLLGKLTKNRYLAALITDQLDREDKFDLVVSLLDEKYPVAFPEITEEKFKEVVLLWAKHNLRVPFLNEHKMELLQDAFQVFHPQPQSSDPYRALVQRLADWSVRPTAGYLCSGLGMKELRELEADAKRLCPQPQAKE